MQQLLVQFGDIELFLNMHSNIASALNSKLLVFFQDVQKNVYLQLELAAIVDWGEHFIKAIYMLEGDRSLGLQCFEVMSTIIAAIYAVAKKLEGKVHGVRLAQLLCYAEGCVEPGLSTEGRYHLKGCFSGF